MNVERHTENGTTYTVGDYVLGTDWEQGRIPLHPGRLTRIEVTPADETSSGEDEVTYWITWEGADAPDPHGTYAFAVADEDAHAARVLAFSLRPKETHPAPGFTLREHMDGGCELFHDGIKVNNYANKARALRAVERLASKN